MWRLAALLLVLAGVSISATSQVVGDDAAVLAAEHRRQQALVRGDLTTLESLLSDDLVYAHSNGKVDSKASYLATLRGGHVRYTAFEPEHVRVRVVDDVAIVHGDATTVASVPGGISRTHLRFTAAWLNRGDGWVMVSWHATRILPTQ